LKTSLIDRIKANSTVKEAEIFETSSFFEDEVLIPTSIPIMNIALSGRLDGGLSSGLTMFAGPSRHFKTNYALLLVATYLEYYKDAVCIFYDTEFGSPSKYLASFGIDTSRVLHTPILDIEQLKIDLRNQLEGIQKGDHVIIIIDSIGNAASKKEMEDSLSGHTTTDMTRAKSLKSLFRVVGPHLNMKHIPMVVINHSYQTLELYSKTVVSGGTGAMYNSDSVFVIGRQQDKNSQKEVTGWNFTIKVEKSRYVKERSELNLSVSYDKGIERYSGLLEIALESKHVVSIKKGKYSRVNIETGEIENKEWSEKNTNTAEFWTPILNDPTFAAFVENKYSLSRGKIMSDDDLTEAIEKEILHG
jgi:RecA/RadA recombinase